MPLSLPDARGPRQCPAPRRTRVAAGARRLPRAAHARDAVPRLLERPAVLPGAADADHLDARSGHRAHRDRHVGVGHDPLLAEVPVGTDRGSRAAAVARPYVGTQALMDASRAGLYCPGPRAARPES